MESLPEYTNEPSPSRFVEDPLDSPKNFEQKRDRIFSTYNKTENTKNVSKDLVEQLAQQKIIDEKKSNYRRKMYQALILLVAFTVNYFNKFRQEYVLLIQGCNNSFIGVASNATNS